MHQRGATCANKRANSAMTRDHSPKCSSVKVLRCHGETVRGPDGSCVTRGVQGKGHGTLVTHPTMSHKAHWGSSIHGTMHASIGTWRVALGPESGWPGPHSPQPIVAHSNTAEGVLSTQRQPPKGGLDTSRKAPTNVATVVFVRP